MDQADGTRFEFREFTSGTIQTGHHDRFALSGGSRNRPVRLHLTGHARKIHPV